MASRGYSILIFLSVVSVILIMSGCLFANESVSIDIYGPDQIAPNVSKADGLKIRINNDVDRDFNDMLVKVTVPEGIHFGGRVMGRPVDLEKGVQWVYSFKTNLEAGKTAEYVFSYQPVIYERQLVDGEYGFLIRIEAFDDKGNSIGNATTTWRVVKA